MQKYVAMRIYFFCANTHSMKSFLFDIKGSSPQTYSSVVKILQYVIIGSDNVLAPNRRKQSSNRMFA